jgi:hypothetical protein
MDIFSIPDGNVKPAASLFYIALLNLFEFALYKEILHRQLIRY